VTGKVWAIVGVGSVLTLMSGFINLGLAILLGLMVSATALSESIAIVRG